MIYILTENLTPGMVTAKPVYDSRTHKLLSAESTLTDRIIRAAINSKIQGMFIIDKFHQLENNEELLTEQDYSRISQALIKMDISALSKEAELITSIMSSKGGRAIDLKDFRICKNDVAGHCINVAIFSCVCGLSMGIGGQKLISLTEAALAHDIGKFKMPPALITMDKESLNESDRNKLRKHPEEGRDLLYAEQGFDAEARSAILLHHEKFDGTGYPKGYAGEKIPIFARIIAVANAYDYVSQGKDFSHGLAQHEATDYLMAGCGTKFDTTVVSEFLKFVALYPAGTEVTLSDGRTVTVIRNKPPFMERPIVATDDNIIIDLTSPENFNLTITKQNNGENDDDINDDC